MSRRGQPWEEATRGGAAIEICGSDAALAAAVTRSPGATVRFEPDSTSDLARALGVRVGAGATRAASEVALDVLRVRHARGGATAQHAVNMIVSGAAPDRVHAWSRRRPCRVEVDGNLWWHGAATTVVVANGEYLRGADVVPRGHPGDGRLEVQVYALAPPARRAMRRRLATGTHLPHPAIRTGQGRRVTVSWEALRPLEIDAIAHADAQVVEVELVAAALRLVL